MIRKLQKIFLVLGLILFIFCFSGCSTGYGQNNGDTESFIHIDYFYNKEDNKLIDNKVTIGIGNSIFDENNNKILSIDDDYYKGITNICISLFVDNEITSIDKVEINSNEFFSNEYAVNLKNNKRTIEDYKKTFEFIISDFKINDYVKFVVSYNWIYQGDESKKIRELYVYGQFIDGEFVISKILSK